MRIGRRLFAWLYNTCLSPVDTPDSADAFTQEFRAPLMARAAGDVLEIGAGNGGNLPYLPADVHLTLLDINPYMLRYLQERAARLNLSAYRALAAGAERLPFPPASFDTVISVHVLCSVADQGRALDEVRRVLRPGGTFLFLEHVAAPRHTNAYRWQRFVNPAWRVIGNGCHLTRDTGAAIRAAGFREVVIDDLRVPSTLITSPHVVGWAVT
jgi:ubiquinone/menaquinone biosynthesis C-methylase UbiE